MPPKVVVSTTRKIAIREAHKKHIELLITELQNVDEKDIISLKTVNKGISEKVEEIKLLDNEILNLLEDDSLVGDEIAESSKHTDNVNRVLVTIDQFLHDIPPSETLSMPSLKSNERSKVRLPKLDV